MNSTGGMHRSGQTNAARFRSVSATAASRAEPRLADVATLTFQEIKEQQLAMIKDPACPEIYLTALFENLGPALQYSLGGATISDDYHTLVSLAEHPNSSDALLRRIGVQDPIKDNRTISPSRAFDRQAYRTYAAVMSNMNSTMKTIDLVLQYAENQYRLSDRLVNQLKAVAEKRRVRGKLHLVCGI